MNEEFFDSLHDFRMHVEGELKNIKSHIDKLYRLTEFYECGCPSHRDQNGIVTVNPNKNPKDNTL